MSKNTYRKAMQEILEGLYELMADLEDIRDEAQECMDENGDAGIRQDIAKMDEAIQILMSAAEVLESSED